MGYARPKAGQPRAPLLKSAGFVGDVVDVVNDYKRSGSSSRDESSERRIWIENGSGSDRTTGEILQISSMTQPSAAISEGFYQSPTMTAIDPVWHTSMDNLFVVHAAVLDGEVIAYHPRRWAMVIVTIMSASDRWVMPDPTTPHRMKTSTSGVWKILGLDTTNNRAIVDMTQSQPLWRYEITEDWQTSGTTTAKLLRLDGTEFASSVEIGEPDPTPGHLMSDQVTGDKGYCVQVGNLFIPQQAVCA